MSQLKEIQTLCDTMEKPNPFKSIGSPPQDVPKHLKEKVMQDIYTAKSLMERSLALEFKNKRRRNI